MKFPAFLTSSFKEPKGIFGILIGKLMTKMNAFVYPEIDKRAAIEDKMHIMEIGFGTGIGIKYFLEKYDITIDGIDYSKQMVNKVKKNFKTQINENKLKIINGDFNSYNETIKQYDRVIFSNVIYFWDNLTHSFGKIKNILKEKGQIIFYMSDGKFLKDSPLAHEKNFLYYEIEKVLKTLKDLNFKNISYERIIENAEYALIVSAQK